MAVQFGSTTIATHSGKPNRGPWDLKVSKNGAFGADGVNVLDGGRSGRSIAIPVWIFGGFGDEGALETYLESVNVLSGQVDSLTNNNEALGQVVFLGLRESYPNHYSGQQASWMFRGVALFEQVRP